MRKNLERILVIASYVVALMMIIILVVVASNQDAFNDLNTGLMRAIIYVLSIVFLLIVTSVILLIFSNNQAVNEVLIYQSECSKTKVTRKVIRKLILQAVENESTIKVKRVRVGVVDGTLRFIVTIEMNETNAPVLIVYLKSLISDMIEHTLELSNYLTDFRIKQIVTDYKVPREEIRERCNSEIEEADEETQINDAETDSVSLTGEDETDPA